MASGLRAWKEQRALGLVPDEDKGRTKIRTRRDNNLSRDNNNMLGSKNADIDTTKRYDIKAKLLKVLDDPKATSQSKAAAGRTLAEIDGLIGRHQRPPDRTAITPINALSRSELEAELQRLRDKVQLTR